MLETCAAGLMQQSKWQEIAKHASRKFARMRLLAGRNTETSAASSSYSVWQPDLRASHWKLTGLTPEGVHTCQTAGANLQRTNAWNLL